MTTRTGVVLVAVDSDAVAELENALRLGALMGAKVHAVRAGRGGVAELGAEAGRSGVPLRRLSGPAAESLLAALDEPEALAMVIGAGTTRRGRHPLGPTSRGVIERARKPVLVVPKGARPRRPMRRLLVPLEGNETTSRPVQDMLLPLFAEQVELVVLHVFTDETLPRMLDRPVRDLQLLGREFLAQHCPPAARIELHPGSVAARVSELCRAEDVDMVVLSWSQIGSSRRALVVREVLGAASLPVLLLPAMHAPTSGAGATPAGGRTSGPS
jgi:nucleotide-binding universal stress UspA family protein